MIKKKTEKHFHLESEIVQITRAHNEETRLREIDTQMTNWRNRGKNWATYLKSLCQWRAKHGLE